MKILLYCIIEKQLKVTYVKKKKSIKNLNNVITFLVSPVKFCYLHIHTTQSFWTKQ